MGLTLEDLDLIPDPAVREMLRAQHPDAAKGTNKFHAKPTVYKGITYHSKGEALHAERLDADVVAGHVIWWTRQVPFWLGAPLRKIVADFLVVVPEFRFDGYPPTSGGEQIRVEEFKGVDTKEWKFNRKVWEEFGPCEMHVIRRGKLAEVIVPRNRRILETPS